MTTSFVGSSKDRQEVGLPGHCDRCATHGHVRAHPDLGCADVGCDRAHDEDPPAAQRVLAGWSEDEKALREVLYLVPCDPTLTSRDVDEFAKLLLPLMNDIRSDAAKEVHGVFDRLFSGGPNTSCRTSFRPPALRGGDPTECVEVPLDDLRETFDEVEAIVKSVR